jgi:hypothetical protein
MTTTRRLIIFTSAKQGGLNRQFRADSETKLNKLYITWL